MAHTAQATEGSKPWAEVHAELMARIEAEKAAEQAEGRTLEMHGHEKLGDATFPGHIRQRHNLRRGGFRY